MGSLRRVPAVQRYVVQQSARLVEELTGVRLVSAEPSVVLACLHDLAGAPDRPEEQRRLVRAEAMLLAGRLREAERAFTGLRQRQGLSARVLGIALDRLGDIAWWRGDFAAAVRYYREALRHRPGDDATKRDLARALWHLGDRTGVDHLASTAAGTKVDVPKGKVIRPDEQDGVVEVFGLYVGDLGSGMLPLQGCREDESNRPVITGSLGRMAQEACEVAWSLWKHRARVRGGGVRIHSPQAAILKDGPSLGLAVFVLIGSVLGALQPVPGDTFTGELDLMGRVLPVGGVEEKALAAYLSGFRRLFLPAANLEEVRESFDPVMELRAVEHVSQVEEALR